MISCLIKYKKSILIITLAFFIGSIGYIGLGSYNRGAFNTNAAMVGATPITYRTLHKATQAQADMLRKNGVDIDEQMNQYLTQQALSGLVVEEILNQAAQQIGLQVSDYELARDIQSVPLFHQNGHFDMTLYTQILKRQFGFSPDEFEESIRRNKLADRFRMALYSLYKLTPEEVRFAYQTQHGNMKDFEKNKQTFEKQLFETKMETAQKAFFDDFNNRVEVKTFLKEQA